MKRGIIALLSVLALAFAFAGCGGSDGSYSASTEQNDVVVDDTQDVVVGTITDSVVNELGISSSLGTPPARPE